LRQQRIIAERMAKRMSPPSTHARKPVPGDRPRKGGQLNRQPGLGALHLTLLVEVRFNDPLVHRERGAGAAQDRAPIDDAEMGVQAQAQALDGAGRQWDQERRLYLALHLEGG
jgi:hypothetical protein